MRGLAPFMDDLSWGRRDFQISFSNRNTPRNTRNRQWGSFMVDTGILSNNMKFPSHKCYMTFCDLTIYNDNPLLINFVPNWPFTEFWEVSIEHLRPVWHTDMGRLLLRSPGPVPLGLAYVLLDETNPFSELVSFTDYALRISLRTFSILCGIRHCTILIR